ncbi:glycosyltransferase [Desulfobacter hydrogenophilus]|uniref:Glycosyltransferase n=1 Tax=Desulfobacter hydrogenophilus TaxID=2291 RepID=A0A328F9V4_9BACT|nr:WecB/TagA/CpsF family glycosyltransferase [Desulfobacter hydrogenophilus]NDY74512.1 WecB/TagA/CpsF family glycosyltransferase [Desulfobacter hydrogenophilus]QBH15065.1 glycosyltransferase [Desulfobacter hydrogenophilus]RAL99914.1 glycosyltransferase [Desulfobacter hydrogenophilus]
MMNKKCDILKMSVDVTSYSETINHILLWSKLKVGKYICVSNIHMCMETYDDPYFCKKVNDADLVVPDGKPLVWAQKLLGNKNALQVRGSDLLLHVCNMAEINGIPIGLYGGTLKSLTDFKNFLKKNFPDLKISFFAAPPFRELTKDEDQNYIKEINTSEARILFVGIGCPKQENWMVAHKNSLTCVMIGVGAAFDFFSGQKKHAPRWMQKSGLEWVFRLVSDPKRLWKRYMKHNPRFMYFFLCQLCREK